MVDRSIGANNATIFLSTQHVTTGVNTVDRKRNTNTATVLCVCSVLRYVPTPSFPQHPSCRTLYVCVCLSLSLSLSLPPVRPIRVEATREESLKTHACMHACMHACRLLSSFHVCISSLFVSINRLHSAIYIQSLVIYYRKQTVVHTP